MIETKKPIGRPRIRDGISATIASWILSGQIPEGTLLPSHKALADQFGVTHMTTWRVIQEMADMGLVHTVPGYGTFAGPPQGATRDFVLHIERRAG